MLQGSVIIIIFLKMFHIAIVYNTNNFPINFNLQISDKHNSHHLTSFPLVNLEHLSQQHSLRKKINTIKDTGPVINFNGVSSFISDIQPMFRRMLVNGLNMNPIHRRVHPTNMLYPVRKSGYSTRQTSKNVHNAYTLPPLHIKTTGLTAAISNSSRFELPAHNRLVPALPATEPTFPFHILSSHDKFLLSLDYFERKFYKVTFNKLMAISAQDQGSNGMSFVQSGFFLQLTLMALSLEVDSDTKTEINKALGLHTSEMDISKVIEDMVSTLPNSSVKLKFRRASRLILWPGREVSRKFQAGGAAALDLNIEKFNGTETPGEMATILNQKIEADSGGAIRETFDDDDFSQTMVAIQTTTLYFRANWRTAPTVLNDTRPFHDAEDAPKRNIRMIKLNDIMGYADIKEWNAEALEILYATTDLSLVMLIPRKPSLSRLANHVMTTSIKDITSRMTNMRIAATLPLYTLRMTLLMPNKLQNLGITQLFDVNKLKPNKPLKLSHMVQRLMFWSEAGRNAYKDDGLNWEATPEKQVVVDRPYIFFVRWRNITLMNGNFVH